MSWTWVKGSADAGGGSGPAQAVKDIARAAKNPAAENAAFVLPTVPPSAIRCVIRPFSRTGHRLSRPTAR
jgi:hypothetical protein